MKIVQELRGEITRNKTKPILVIKDPGLIVLSVGR